MSIRLCFFSLEFLYALCSKSLFLRNAWHKSDILLLKCFHVRLSDFLQSIYDQVAYCYSSPSLDVCLHLQCEMFEDQCHIFAVRIEIFCDVRGSMSDFCSPNWNILQCSRINVRFLHSELKDFVWFFSMIVLRPTIRHLKSI